MRESRASATSSTLYARLDRVSAPSPAYQASGRASAGARRIIVNGPIKSRGNNPTPAARRQLSSSTCFKALITRSGVVP